MADVKRVWTAALFLAACAALQTKDKSARADWPVEAVAAAENLSCAVFANGQVACVGRTRELTGNVHVLSESPAAHNAPSLALPTPVRTISAHQGPKGLHACVVDFSGQAYCWGGNAHGEAGAPADQQLLSKFAQEKGIPLQKLKHFRPSSGAVRMNIAEPVSAVTVGRAHACALTTSGMVWCWGDNSIGQLGLGISAQAPQSSAQPLQAKLFTAAELQQGLHALQISSGWQHSCALLSDGNVRCWGDNHFGQLGFTATARNDGDMDSALMVMSAPAEKGNIPLFSEAERKRGARATYIAAAAERTCALTQPGKVRCWGENRWAKLGYPSEKYEKVSAVRPPHELGDILLAEPVRSLAMAETHACAVSLAEKIYCWGSNSNGQLGDAAVSSTEQPGSMPPKAVPLLSAGENRKVRSVALGQAHTCVLFDNGRMRCWGLGFDGQLGTGFAKKFGQKGCMNNERYCLGDEPGELPPPDVTW